MTLAFALALRACFIVPGAIGLAAVLFMNGTNDRVFREWKLAAGFAAFGMIGLL